MGAGVANLVTASLLYGECGGNADNVYCYTFAVPNTFYLTDNKYERENRGIEGKKITGNYREPHGVKYRCIFNIVNEDDFVPKLPMEKCEWTKYGRVATLSCIEIKNSITKPEKSYEMFLKKVYKCNRSKINIMIEEFNGIYKDYQIIDNNMRKDTYSHYEEIKNFKKKDILENNKNARPYQKIVDNKQYQLPAYFLQSIAHSVHSLNDKPDKDGVIREVKKVLIFGNEHKRLLFFLSVAKRYEIAKDKLINARNDIELPHYIESYYSLSKETQINIFR